MLETLSMQPEMALDMDNSSNDETWRRALQRIRAETGRTHLQFVVRAART